MEDGRIARDRCLAAIPGADEETQRALWKAALRYRRKMLATRSVGTGAGRLVMPGHEGSFHRLTEGEW